MLAGMSSAEFTEWMAFFRCEREDQDDRKLDEDLSRSAAAGLKQRIKRMKGK